MIKQYVDAKCWTLRNQLSTIYDARDDSPIRPKMIDVAREDSSSIYLTFSFSLVIALIVSVWSLMTVLNATGVTQTTFEDISFAACNAITFLAFSSYVWRHFQFYSPIRVSDLMDRFRDVVQLFMTGSIIANVVTVSLYFLIKFFQLMVSYGVQPQAALIYIACVGVIITGLTYIYLLRSTR